VEKKITPVDHLTGLPLPIYPYSDYSEYSHSVRYPGYDPFKTIWHHHFHPEADLPSNKKGALFLRHSRVQLVPAWLHDDYHDIYEGPPIPKNIYSRYLMGIFAVAGYMPKNAIDVPNSRFEDEIIPLNFHEYKGMQQPGMLKGEYIRDNGRLKWASRFMMSVVLKQDIKAINELTLEEFLITPDKDRRIKLAAHIIDKLVDQSTLPINDKYQRARHNKRIINRGLVTPRDVVLSVTRPLIPENIIKLDHKILKDLAA